MKLLQPTDSFSLKFKSKNLIYPPAREASREVANLKERKNLLATLLEGVNKKIFKVNFKKILFFKNGFFKAEKLDGNVIIVINECLRTSFRELNCRLS